MVLYFVMIWFKRVWEDRVGMFWLKGKVKNAFNKTLVISWQLISFFN